jgi:methylated-DNA-protein-cysteine methyltransferase-like protein
MNDFYQQVYEVVSMIPSGKVTTYGSIAAFLGAGRSSRLVGRILSTAGSIGIPCHRVVNSSGELTGSPHFSTPSLMRKLLEAEGVQFKGKRVDMAQHFWDPATMA